MMKVTVEIGRDMITKFLQEQGATRGRSISISEIEEMMKNPDFKQWVSDDIFMRWSYDVRQALVNNKTTGYQPKADPDLLEIIDPILSDLAEC